ncbi:MAG: hypothetical protein ACP5O3_02550 [Candidatus Micrarchaeia archaeon]
MASTILSFAVDAFALVLAVILIVYLAAYWAAHRQRVKKGFEKEKHYYYRTRMFAAAVLFVVTTFLRLFQTHNEWVELAYSLLNVAILIILIMTFSLVRFEMNKK